LHEQAELPPRIDGRGGSCVHRWEYGGRSHFGRGDGGEGRLAELANRGPSCTVEGTTLPGTPELQKASAKNPASSNPGPPAHPSVSRTPKRLSLADLREAARRRREAAA